MPRSYYFGDIVSPCGSPADSWYPVPSWSVAVVLARPPRMYPFPKPPLSIKFDIFDIIFDTTLLVAYRTVDHSLGPARLPNTVACVWGLMCMLVHASDIVCGPLVAPRHARPTVHQYTSSIHMGGRRAAHAVGSPPAGPAASRAAVRTTPTPRPPRRRSTRLSVSYTHLTLPTTPYV